VSSDISVAVIGAIAAVVSGATAAVGAWLGARSTGKHSVEAATLPARQNAYKAALDLLLPELEALRKHCSTVSGSRDMEEPNCTKPRAQLDDLMLCAPDELVPALRKVSEAIAEVEDTADSWIGAMACLERVGDEAIRLSAADAYFTFERACRNHMMSAFFRGADGGAPTPDTRELRTALQNADADDRLLEDATWLAEHYAAEFAALRDAVDALVSARTRLVEDSRVWLQSP
jgi:hypothetical protein